MWKIERESWALWEGDCLAMLAELPDCSVDSVVTDPPYGLNGSTKIDTNAVLRAWIEGSEAPVKGGGFMGHTWDAWVPGPRVWAECLRVLKPGGHLIAFAGTRTQQWMGIALELGGFEVRDCGAWCYWSGFPKSLDISKAIDKAAGAEREVTRTKTANQPGANFGGKGIFRGTKNEITEFRDNPTTPEAKRYQGFGTAIKPAHEPWILARKPLSERTIAANVLRWGGCGALNLDACRFAQGDTMWSGPQDKAETRRNSKGGERMGGSSTVKIRRRTVAEQTIKTGRYPANVLYCPKPSTREREAGCGALEAEHRSQATGRKEGSAGANHARAGVTAKFRKNSHPTVKPLRLMAWLVRLVTPPGGVVVDPFCGSGTTGAAAVPQGFRFIGADLGGPDGRYTRIAQARIEHWDKVGLDSVIGFADNRRKEDK